MKTSVYEPWIQFNIEICGVTSVSNFKLVSTMFFFKIIYLFSVELLIAARAFLTVASGDSSWLPCEPLIIVVASLVV